jgi:hypothetical protein
MAFCLFLILLFLISEGLGAGGEKTARTNNIINSTGIIKIKEPM